MSEADGKQYSDRQLYRQADPFKKWQGPYHFSSDELQGMVQKNTSPIWTATFDLGTAQSPTSPMIINQPGRAFRITGMTTTTKYSLAANTGIETVVSTVFVGVSILNMNGNNQSISDPSEIVYVKHGGGFRGDFPGLALFWPQQTSNSFRIHIYKYDGVPWATGDAST